MTPDTYFAPLKNQSLLYPGQSQVYRGQCVQSVMLWLKATGTEPPVYPSAYQYFQRGIPGYTKIPAGQPIKAEDIVVWRPDFPPAITGGVGNGHIDVAAQDGTAQDFWAWESNWSPPLRLNRIRHNGPDNSYIFGYLRKEENMLDEEAANLLADTLRYNPGVGADPGFKSSFIGKPLKQVLVEFQGSQEFKDRRAQLGATGDFEPVTEQLFKKKG